MTTRESENSPDYFRGTHPYALAALSRSQISPAADSPQLGSARADAHHGHRARLRAAGAPRALSPGGSAPLIIAFATRLAGAAAVVWFMPLPPPCAQGYAVCEGRSRHKAELSRCRILTRFGLRSSRTGRRSSRTWRHWSCGGSRVPWSTRSEATLSPSAILQEAGSKAPALIRHPPRSQVRRCFSRSRTVGRHCHLRPAPAALHRRLGERGESASLKVASEQEPSISRFPPVSPQVLLHLGVMQQVSRAHACLNIARRALTMCAHSLLRRRLRRKRRRRRAMT